MNTLGLICWAEERHKYYCQIACRFMMRLGKQFKSPKFSLFASKVRTAGWARYSKGICDYNLSFLLAAKEDYEQTIAHEVAHFVVRNIEIGAKSHGDLFMFVLRDILGGENKRYHDYNRELKHITQAIVLMKIVKLNEKKIVLKDAAERGK